MITVLRDKFARSWPVLSPDKPLRPVDRCYVLPLAEALERPYSTDAHLTCYRTPNKCRLNAEALKRGTAVTLTAVMFDVDCGETHGTSSPAPESWRREAREKMLRLFEEHGAGFFYETKGGCRIVYRQAEPTVLRSEEDAQRWSQDYAIGCAYLNERFGIVADPACADWQRLYRLPRATRDKAERPENWPCFGDPRRIGTLMIRPSRAEVLAAKKTTKAFDQRKIRELTNCVTSGTGVLFELFRARGDIGRERRPGAFVIRCPNEPSHTVGVTGNTSTILVPPDPGTVWGVIVCKHAHCQGLRLRDWLRFFSDQEIEAAKRAAGIVRAA